MKFSQPSCTPCKILSNYLQENDVEYEEYDVFEDGLLASQFGIMGGLPVLVLVDGDEVLGQTTGFNPSNTSNVDELIKQL